MKIVLDANAAREELWAPSQCKSPGRSERRSQASAARRRPTWSDRSALASVRKEDLQTLKEFSEAGKAKPVIERTYPVSEVPELSDPGSGATPGAKS